MLVTINEYLHDLNFVTIVFRMFLAVLYGGVIGVERGRKGRPAGLRTHILVCLGAAIAIMTNEYILESLGTGDPTRIGAQVVSGVGFLCAGTIMVTGRNHVKGLTTAATLWAGACMGLAVGVGFYSGSFVACVFIYITNIMLPKYTVYLRENASEMNVYAELANISAVSGLVKAIRSRGIAVSDLEVHKSKIKKEQDVIVTFTLNISDRELCKHAKILDYLRGVKDLNFVEEI